MTLAFILAAPDSPDDASNRYADSPAARQARNEATAIAARDRVWAESIRSDDTGEAQRALTGVMHAYADRLIRFAYGFAGSADAAEDIVQDAFIRVWARRATIRPDESLRAYLFTTVRHTALDMLKRRNIETRYAASVAGDVGDDQMLRVDEDMDTESVAQAVRAAMNRLSERRQTALRLRYEEQLPFAIVAEVMGLSEKAAKHLVTRAVEEVRGYLGL